MNSTSLPNVVLFVTDDHGQWASSPYGHYLGLTPNMQFLADRGVTFDRAFTPSPVCSPARASLMTGRMPSQHGIHDWLDDRSIPPPPHPALEDQMTLPQLLQQAGYYTGLVGKWHCGFGAAPAPGFDRWFSYFQHQYPHFGLQQFSDQGRLVERFGHQTPILTDQAIQFLRHRPTSSPFFLQVGYVNTHSPYQDKPDRLLPRPEHLAWEGLSAEALVPGHSRAEPKQAAEPAQRRRRQLQYCAAVRMIDEQIGRLLDELESLALRDNTLIIYTSDHGLMCGHHGLYGKGNTTTPQNFLEESILVPLLMSQPGALPPGRRCSEMVDHCDLFGTIAAAAGVTPYPAGLNGPGRSFLDVAKGDTPSTWRQAQFCEYGNARMIRTAQFKYIARAPAYGREWVDELYDLTRDPRETTNLIGDSELTEVVAKLSQDLHRHFAIYSEERNDGWQIEKRPACNRNMPWMRGKTQK